MKRNSELLHKVADLIDEHPERYNQHVWAGVPQGENLILEFGSGRGRDMIPDCGTVACIAGHAALLDGWGWDDGRWVKLDARWVTPEIPARRALGLTKSEALILFGSDWKPHPELSVADALRALADNPDLGIHEVSALEL